MANTFSLTFSGIEGRYLMLECTQSKDIAGNQSAISWTLTSAGGAVNYYGTGPTSVVINGKEVYSKSRVSSSFPAVKGSISGTTTIYHDSLGNAEITCSISSAIYTKTVTTVSDKWTLDNIPRAAQLVTVNDFNDEMSGLPVTYRNPAGNSVDVLWVSVCDADKNAILPWEVITDKTGSTYTYPLDDDKRNTLYAWATANKMKIKYGLCTRIGEVDYYEYKDAEFTILNSEPTLNPTVEDVGSNSVLLTQDPTGTIIKGYNSIEYRFNAGGVKGASIADYSLTCGGVKINNDNSNKVYNVESGEFVFSVTDTRGLTTTKTITLDLVEYIKPTCNYSIKMELDGETSAKAYVTLTGNYYDGMFGNAELSSGNELQIQMKRSNDDGSEGYWYRLTGGYVEVPVENNVYTLETVVTGLRYDVNYTFSFRVWDATGLVHQVETTPYTVGLNPVFDWGENDFNFNVPIRILGQYVSDWIIETGTEAMGSNGTWYWEKWASGKAVCYGRRNFGNMGVSIAWGALYSSQSFSQSLPYGLFVDKPTYVNIDVVDSAASGFVSQGYNNATTKDTIASFCLYSARNETFSQVHFGFYVVGKWK
jgi:hypothetical protein